MLRCQWCPGRAFKNIRALRTHQNTGNCQQDLDSLLPARSVRPRLTAAATAAAAGGGGFQQQQDLLHPDTQPHDEQLAQEAGAQQSARQPQQQQQQPVPHHSQAEQLPDADMQTDAEQALHQQLLVMDPVTGDSEPAHLPVASHEQLIELEDSAPDPSAFAGLPWESRELVAIITELPHQARDRLLRLLAKPNFNAQNVKWKNAAELNAFLDGTGAQVSLRQTPCATGCSSALASHSLLLTLLLKVELDALAGLVH